MKPCDNLNLFDFCKTEDWLSGLKRRSLKKTSAYLKSQDVNLGREIPMHKQA
jgi:hypothetical protein